MLYKALEENAREADGTGTPCPPRKRKVPARCPSPVPDGNGAGARVEKYKRRHWAAYDADGVLVCVCVYRKGAEEVVRRVAPPAAPPE
ncbi:MAG: hypothetical protein JWN14_4388 [Chthonomonadales bacterium]|nr:hypothetical protein [Chthonomonadales bacterium]